MEYPTLNGFAPSWADISTSFSVSGGPILEMADYAGIKWKRSVEVGEQRGASGGIVLNTTVGSASQEASATLYRSGHRKLIRSLASVAPSRGNQKRISLVGFTIVILHTPPGESDIYTVEIRGCRLIGDDAQMQEGPDADKLEISLNPKQVVNIENGVEIVLL